MGWVRNAIDSGQLSVLQPRGLAQATRASYPLKEGVKYRTSWDPRKGHYVMPGTDHSFCGLGLVPPEDPDFGVNSGWDEVWWFIEDTRQGDLCGRCATQWGEWRSRKPNRTLPTDSPISPDEWAKQIKPLTELEKRKWDMLIARINSVLPVEEATSAVQ